MDKGSTWQLVGLAAAGVGVVAIAAKYGVSSSSSFSPPTVSADALSAVTSAAATEHGQDTDLSIAKVQAAANTLVSLKSLEEQVQLGEISLEQAQAQYASQVSIADAGFASATTISGQQTSAAVAEANAASAAQQKQAQASTNTSFWGDIFGAITSVWNTITNSKGKG